MVSHPRRQRLSCRRQAKGNLYGTTYYAGKYDLGTVYRLSRRNGVWTQTWMYSFKGGTDGSSPISTLAADAAGNLYGTTSEGVRRAVAGSFSNWL